MMKKERNRRHQVGGNLPFSWINRITMMKMLVLLKVIYRLGVFPIIIPRKVSDLEQKGGQNPEGNTREAK